MTSTAVSGRAREHRARDWMVERGWHFVMRSAGSKGSADLLMAHLEHGAALIQVGTPNKTLGPADRVRFVNDADLCGALALLVTVEHHPGRASDYRVLRVTNEAPSRWERFDV